MKRSRLLSTAVGSFFRPFPDRFVRKADGFIFSALVIISVFSPGHLSAQSLAKIAGHVYDAADGHPIGHAEIRIQNSTYKTYTDPSGQFSLENIPDGQYRIDVNASGYLPSLNVRVNVVADITRQVTFHLERKVVNLGEREIRGMFIPLSTGNTTIIDRNQIEECGGRTLADVLNRLEGVYIQESGTLGSRKQASIRGSDSKHVLVLVDGQRFNNSGSGEVDLSSIPLEMVEKVEVYRGGQSAQFGADALAGVVNIITHVNNPQKSPELSISQYHGKWKTAERELVLINPLRANGLTTKVAVGYRNTEGNFEYNYEVLPRHNIERKYEGTRENADFESRNYFFSCLYQKNAGTIWSLSGQLYRSRQGLPGRVSSPDLYARKSDKRFLGSARLQHEFSGQHHMEMSLGFSRLKQEFENQSDPFRYQSRYINDIADWKTISYLELWKGSTLGNGIEFQRDILYHDEVLNPDQSIGRTVRDNFGLFVIARQTFNLDKSLPVDMVVLDVSARRDNTDNRKDTASAGESSTINHLDHWSYKAGVSISRGVKTRLVIRGNYGTSYRLPSINALFWKGDVYSHGNPDLKPELSEHSDAGIEISAKGWADISAGITYFHSRVRDIIVWHRSSPQGLWKPDNLDAARITGHEDFIRVGLFENRLRLSYANTVTIARNKSRGTQTYNKFLTFRPHYVTDIGCRVRLWKFQGSYNVRMVDVRYALDSSTKWYGAYRIDNADIGFATGIFHLILEIDYRIKNLGAENYELIAQYPMPGREWGISFSLSYRFD